jgi:hypothetical protein
MATMSINRNQHKNQLKKIQKNPLEYIAIKFDTQYKKFTEGRRTPIDGNSSYR